MKVQPALVFLFLLLFSHAPFATAEPFKSRNFPSDGVIAYNYNKLMSSAAPQFEETLEAGKESESGWQKVLCLFQSNTPSGLEMHEALLFFKRLDTDNWLMKGEGLGEVMLENPEQVK
jgi:hypothetical protein